MENIEQEIEWLKEEIESDEFVMDSKDASSFHQSRIDENRIKLQELTDIKEASNRGIDGK
jgi:hypothetical protein